MKNNSLGLTLLEVLIVMGISGLVGALLLVIILSSAGLFYQQSSKVGQGVTSNDALSEIRSVVKESSAIQSSYTDGAATYMSSSQQLVLSLGSIDGSGNLIANTYDFFVFFKDSDKLRFKSFLDPKSFGRKSKDQILSLNVQTVSFQYFNSQNPPQEVSPTSATKIKITLTLRQKSGSSYESSTATSEASLRND